VTTEMSSLTDRSTNRDRSLRRVRRATWGVGAAVAALATGLSVVAAHAFKGHNGASTTTTTAPPASHQEPTHHHHVTVPAPQYVPPISATPLAPPDNPPSAAPQQQPAPTPAPQPVQPAPTPAPAPAPVPVPAPSVSGGS